MPPKQQEEEEDDDTEIIVGLVKAHAIAEQLFGERANVYAVEEIDDYLTSTNDEESLATDFKYAVEQAKVVFKTEAPTPEQALMVFKKLYDPKITLQDVMEKLESRRK